jgi:protein-tyrosine-phosphatase
MNSILFVCTANRYRSPIAAACFRAELVRRGQDKNWMVSSAGTWAMNGYPAMPAAMLEARRLGLDIQEHQSRGITADMLRESDLVVVMERGHKEALQVEFKAYRQKVVLLSEVAEESSYDIADPVTDPETIQVGPQICRLIQMGFDTICARAIEIPDNRKLLFLIPQSSANGLFEIF